MVGYRLKKYRCHLRCNLDKKFLYPSLYILFCSSKLSLTLSNKTSALNYHLQKQIKLAICLMIHLCRGGQNQTLGGGSKYLTSYGNDVTTGPLNFRSTVD